MAGGLYYVNTMMCPVSYRGPFSHHLASQELQEKQALEEQRCRLTLVGGANALASFYGSLVHFP